ncbi:MAG: Zn-dependent hydrolase [Verrucomicrobiota bacterium]
MTSRPQALSINFKRLQNDLNELAKIGRRGDDPGIYRMAFTEEDMVARDWLIGKMKAAGIPYRVDGAANLIGHWPPDNQRPAVLMGSHMDTVPCGGHLDGSLGVLAALEVLRCLIETGREYHYPAAMISFTDEEGRFGGMFGSQSFAGLTTPETILTSMDLDGVRLEDMMKRRGFDPMEALDARRDPKTVKCYLELHIEQGPVLDEGKIPVGIVENITGLFRWSAVLSGKPNHAGTTPMPMRKDAFQGLAEFANSIPRIVEENGGEDSRATIGNVTLLPGSANTIPGRVEFSLDVRDTSADTLEELRDAFRKALSAIARRRGLHFEFEEVSDIEPVHCSDRIVETIAGECERLELEARRMPSGAAHDAQVIATMAPVGMIFVPSKGGQSHSPAEWTAWHDIEAGVNLALNTMARLCSKEEED